MGSNFAARVATAPDLAIFRSPGQWSRLGLAIQHPVTVYTCRINQSTFADGLAELTIDGGSGTLSDVLAGMVVYIGSSAGAADRGSFRVRKLPISTKLYINQVSGIPFQEDDFVSVIDAFDIAQRDLTVAGGIVRMDYDIDFGDYRNGGPLVAVAPLVAVLHLADGVDGVVTFTPPTPVLSGTYDGVTIVSHHYDAPGAATTADMDTNAPSWTYDTAGEYRFSDTATDSLGREVVTYRRVFVDPDKIPFKFEDGAGDPSSGNWSFTARCLADVAKTQVRDRAMVTLYGTDYYNSTTKGAVGKIEGYENIYCTGWVDGESIEYDSESGDVIFTVQGPAHWLSKLRAFPFELQDVSGVPANWKEITEMTVDKALAFMLFWTSTAPLVMDCYLIGDTTRIPIIAEPGGNLWDQISAIALKIFAEPKVNNYGQLYVEIDSQLISSTDRASLPVVMDITKADRLDGLEIERNTSAKTSQIEMGVWTYDGTSKSAVYSRAPGMVPMQYGEPDSLDDYYVLDQEECNRIVGCWLALSNNEIEPFDITFSANNRLFDICPRMYATITILAADNPRGIAITAARIIPRKVQLVPDEDSSSVLTKVTFEFEVIGMDGVMYVPPPMEDNGIEDYGIDDFDFGGVDFPNAELGDYFPTSIPTGVTFPGDCNPYINNYYSVSWDKSHVGLAMNDVTDERIARLYFPCKIRSNAMGGSYIDLPIQGNFYGDAATHFAVFGVKDGSRVVTGTVINDGARVNFAPLAATDIDYFELELEAGLGSSITYVAKDIIASGTVQANNGTGIAITTVAGQYYAVENPVNSIWGLGAGILVAGVYNCIFIYRTSEPYSELSSHRLFYQAVSGTEYVTVNADTSGFADNSGSSAYTIRNAFLQGRMIFFHGATIHNVCEAG